MTNETQKREHIFKLPEALAGKPKRKKSGIISLPKILAEVVKELPVLGDKGGGMMLVVFYDADGFGAGMVIQDLETGIDPDTSQLELTGKASDTGSEVTLLMEHPGGAQALEDTAREYMGMRMAKVFGGDSDD